MSSLEFFNTSLDISGYYSFYHDGWPCSLSLNRIDENDFEGKLRDFRWGHDFQVAAQVQNEDLSVVISIKEFNQMALQEFQGYVFGSRYHLLAGVTQWHGIPYGFFARKGDFLYLSQFGTDTRDVQSQHFLGEYVVWFKSLFYNLQLFTLKKNRIIGELKLNGHEHAIVVGHLDDKFHHHIKMSAQLDGMALEIYGYISSHARNAIAGYASFGEHKTGIYMIKTNELS